jgi:DNA-directed RNA polymerase subunit E'/Rpb7
MEQTVIFEEKVYLTPKDMNRLAEESVDTVLLEHVQTKFTTYHCSQHGFVLPNTLTLLSRSMGQLDNGRYTGNILFHVQLEGTVYNPVNGTKITGTILKKNKMGLYVIYKDAVRILVARDLHPNNEEFESLEVGDLIQVEIRKSRFQIRDPFILSIGVYLGKGTIPDEVLPPAPPAPVSNAKNASGSTNSMPSLERNSPPAPAPAAPVLPAPAETIDDDDDLYDSSDEESEA